MLSPAQKKIAADVAALVHADKKREAAQYVAEISKIPLKLDGDDPSKYIPVLINWLHWLLNNEAPFEAAELLWTPNLFDSRPLFTQQVWELFDTASRGLILGGGSCSKSFALGARLFLEWIRDPDWTTVRVAGPSQDHLEANLFSALIRLHSNASLPMPGETGELFIGADRRNQLGSIKGIVVPLGKLKKSGRLQGTKRERRIKVHPTFGEQTRLFIACDEFENIPQGIWADIDNILSNTSADVRNFKIFGAYNPRDQSHEVAKRAEPPFGWENFDIDQHYRWKSKRGWEVLRLDGEKCENVIEGRTIFPGLQTREGLQAIAENSGGRDSAGYFTMGRGAYPKQGVVTAIIPVGMFTKSRGEFLWTSDPTPVTSCDLALEGGAAASFSVGAWGMASGMKLPPNVEFPNGRTVMFRNATGQVVPRYGLQLNSQLPLPKGDSVAMAKSNITLNKKLGVKPLWFSCDRTGVGGGTADIMKHEWGGELHDVNYSDGPSETKLMQEDSRTCKEEYDRMQGELWYALRAFLEYGYLLINPTMDATELQEQVTTRLVKHSGLKSKVESKKDFMDRGHKSPDEADSLTLLVHAARKGSGVILSRLGEAADAFDLDADGWYDAHYRGGARISADNRQDYLP